MITGWGWFWLGVIVMVFGCVMFMLGVVWSLGLDKDPDDGHDPIPAIKPLRWDDLS